MPNNNEMIFDYSDNNPKIMSLADICLANNNIDQSLYTKYDVKEVCVIWTARAFWQVLPTFPK